MKYKCTNKRCGTTTTEADDKDGKLYCPVCHYEVQEVIKKHNPFKQQFEGNQELQTTNNDRLDKIVCACATGLLMKGKITDDAIPSEAVKMAKKIIEEIG